MAYIQTKNLNFTFNENKKKTLNNINIEIEKGEIVVIFGKSGSGKTTLLRQFKSAITPSGQQEGEIKIDGKNSSDIDLKTQAEKIGFLLNDTENQIVNDKVYSELCFGMENLGYDRHIMHKRAVEVSTWFGIEKLFYKLTSSLSGGEKQKLNLASIFTLNPDILLLDEPLSSLDPINRDNFAQMIKKINDEEGTTIVIAEHEMSDIISIADKIIVMEDGNILHMGKKEDIVKKIIENKKYIPFLPNKTKLPALLFNNYSVFTNKEAMKCLNKLTKDKITREKRKSDEKDIITLKNVYFKYEKDTENILNNINLSIKEKDFIGVVGSNGSGKTTLLKVMAGILRAYKGKVKFNENLKFSYLPQDTKYLFSKNSVKEELGFEIEEKELLNVHPYDLSTGQRQLIALYKVLKNKPDILLLDEVTRGMDVMYKKRTGEILKKLNKKMTIILISHDIDFLARYTKDALLLFKGEILEKKQSDLFFDDNFFYSTSVNKIAKHKVTSALFEEDIYDTMRYIHTKQDTMTQ